ncbi:unnamed protein product [Caenorhabditis auriculariae]|uniref:Uncharacterized protein n=1 Tax=Caenorhabditis auriculariae TaxID=2777116 RepID=A0A8S1H6Z0_9PELO|nr:unnamed protein product [Caenorhabditis auriculariae]
MDQGGSDRPSELDLELLRIQIETDTYRAENKEKDCRIEHSDPSVRSAADFAGLTFLMDINLWNRLHLAWDVIRWGRVVPDVSEVLKVFHEVSLTTAETKLWLAQQYANVDNFSEQQHQFFWKLLHELICSHWEELNCETKIHMQQEICGKTIYFEQYDAATREFQIQVICEIMKHEWPHNSPGVFGFHHFKNRRRFQFIWNVSHGLAADVRRLPEA